MWLIRRVIKAPVSVKSMTRSSFSQLVRPVSCFPNSFSLPLGSPNSSLSRRTSSVRMPVRAHQPKMSCFSSTSSSSNSENEIIPVPSMGDSISEGTVVDLIKAEGEAVSVDEVVVVIETDKVSVDIRSPVSGVLVKHFTAVDDIVEVGAPLFSLETGAPSTLETSIEVPTSSSSNSDNSNSSSPTSSAGARGRTPLIQFLGKRSPPILPSIIVPSPSDVSSTTPTIVRHPEIMSNTTTTQSSFGRLPVSEEERQAIRTGYYELR